MSIAVIILSLAIFTGILIVIFNQQKKSHSLSRSVLIGLVLGSLFGLGLQVVLGEGQTETKQVLSWIAVIGIGYVRLLKMVVMPLILVSMISAVVRLEKNGALGKISTYTIGILLFTTAIAALIAILITQTFGLTAEG